MDLSEGMASSVTQTEKTSPAKSFEYRLDLLTFALSGLRDGLGPLLGVFLIQKTHWDAFQIASVLAASSITNLVLQIPIGCLYDTTVSPYLLVGSGALCLVASCFIVSLVPTYFVALSSQILVGIGGCLLSVGLPALSVRSTPTELLRKRLARNEIFSKIGNFCSIGLMGYVSQKFNLSCMFYVIYFAASLLVTTCINGFSFDRLTSTEHSCSHSPSKKENQIKDQTVFTQLLFRRPLLPILATGFIYQFANASMFMIFEQQWVRQQVNGGIGLISSSLLLTQLTIVAASLVLNRSNRPLSVGTAMQAGLLLITLRGVILLSGSGAISLFVSQFLDGLIATLLIIVPISFIARVAGSAFNRMSAAFGMVIVAAASLSTLCSGFTIAHAGFSKAYLLLIAVALLGAALTSALKAKCLFD